MPESISSLIAFIASVGVTIFARLFIGNLCDKIGPRKSYIYLLLFGAVVVAASAFAWNWPSYLISRMLIGVIGVAMVLFVASDLLNSGGGSFNQVDTEVGVINGTSISYQEFENKIAQATSGQSVGADQLDQVRNRVWNQLLQENIIYKSMYNRF